MRITNPTKENIWRGGTLHFYPLKIEGPQPLGLPYPAIEYLEREDTLEAGDEFVRSDNSTRRAMAIAEGYVMFHNARQNVVHTMKVSEITSEPGFKITKKHSDSA